METYTCTLETPIGALQIAGTEAGISAITFLDNPAPASESIPPDLAECARQLEEYFAGTRKEFTFELLPQGTPFERRVWAHLLDIPFGETRTYMQIAEALGDPKSIRAVGRANGRNPIAIVVPCHRVIGSNGDLVGYGGGLWRKEWLLSHEGRPVQQALF
ncbi:MAG: methylated-DNA--[protein]-cysteine S-methyltransferase [Chloroflexi bacterium]|nr:methylated-DNA--[protein]-cysteine S-methyltransferase [Chloroflexota bacterium]